MDETPNQAMAERAARRVGQDFALWCAPQKRFAAPIGSKKMDARGCPISNLPIGGLPGSRCIDLIVNDLEI
jgi:hypothetical protein